MRAGDGEHAFRFGIGAIEHDPLRLRCRYGSEVYLREALRTEAAVEVHHLVIDRVKLNYRHRMGGRARRSVVGALNGSNSSDLGCLAGQPPAHHRAVGHAGRKDPPLVNVRLALDAGDDFADEADVVDLVADGRCAAGPGIPRAKYSASEAAVAIGKDRNKPSLLRLADQPVFGIVGLVVCTSTAAVQREEHRSGAAAIALGHMHKILPGEAVALEAEAIVARRGQLGRVRVGWLMLSFSRQHLTEL